VGGLSTLARTWQQPGEGRLITHASLSHLKARSSRNKRLSVTWRACSAGHKASVYHLCGVKASSWTGWLAMPNSFFILRVKQKYASFYLVDWPSCLLSWNAYVVIFFCCGFSNSQCHLPTQAHHSPSIHKSSSLSLLTGFLELRNMNPILGHLRLPQHLIGLVVGWPYRDVGQVCTSGKQHPHDLGVLPSNSKLDGGSHLEAFIDGSSLEGRLDVSAGVHESFHYTAIAVAQC